MKKHVEVKSETRKKTSLITTISMLLFFVVCQGFSQEVKHEVKKVHFIFQFSSPDCDTLFYYDAISNWGDIEKYRLINRRRHIPVIKNLSNENVTLILFSAQELKSRYNREIHEDNLPDEKEQEVVIVLDEQNGKVRHVKQ